jgi:predicted ATP-grasp superfamily ATP-dependent carboligase
MLRVVDQIAMLVCGIPPIGVVGVLAPPVLAHFGSFWDIASSESWGLLNGFACVDC